MTYFAFLIGNMSPLLRIRSLERTQRCYHRPPDEPIDADGGGQILLDGSVAGFTFRGGCQDTAAGALPTVVPAASVLQSSMIAAADQIDTTEHSPLVRSVTASTKTSSRQAAWLKARQRFVILLNELVAKGESLLGTKSLPSRPLTATEFLLNPDGSFDLLFPVALKDELESLAIAYWEYASMEPPSRWVLDAITEPALAYRFTRLPEKGYCSHAIVDLTNPDAGGAMLASANTIEDALSVLLTTLSLRHHKDLNGLRITQGMIDKALRQTRMTLSSVAERGPAVLHQSIFNRLATFSYEASRIDREGTSVYRVQCVDVPHSEESSASVADGLFLCVRALAETLLTEQTDEIQGTSTVLSLRIPTGTFSTLARLAKDFGETPSKFAKRLLQDGLRTHLALSSTSSASSLSSVLAEPKLPLSSPSSNIARSDVKEPRK